MFGDDKQEAWWREVPYLAAFTAACLVVVIHATQGKISTEAALAALVSALSLGGFSRRLEKRKGP